MSLQMQLIFTALVVELVTLSILVLPLPSGIQDKVVNFAYMALTNQTITISVVFCGGINALIFFDSLQKVINKKYDTGVGVIRDSYGNVIPGGNIWDIRAQKFYNERNMYITGAILFLGLALYFNVLLLKSLVKNKKKLRNLTKGLAADGSVKTGGDSVSELKLDELRGQLKKNQATVLALQKQLDGVHTEYQRKADEVSAASADVKSSLKKDA
ncbi:unnamed protein product [Ambrosiozyma monospora]|uniref:Endoplasmic reticulum transmembrane protein n=1 Tax=Ambrosiozyma monospora TaxID=43982 RepID=A0A9W6Z363_AMBMO|nr:unnamed protein product [Ambrosiozyma monospora]